MSNIANNNFNDLDLRISTSEYWDFVLSKENDFPEILDGSNFYDGNIISYIDINNNSCIVDNNLYSIPEYKWGESINNGLSLFNYGLNGIDNGFITFDKNNTSSDDFVEIITGGTKIPLNIDAGDYRLILRPVSGNTGEYEYPIQLTGDTINDFYINYAKLNGGFYQGFFKSEDYSILPDSIKKEMSFDFVIKPDFTSFDQPGTLNYKYVNNKGFFFYLGLRSENKFWYEYAKNDINNYEISKTGQTSPLSSGTTLFTNDNFPINSQNTYDIKTDNKYLLFNRSENGRIASLFDDNAEYHITGITKENINYYESVNRTWSGKTASSVNSISGYTKQYDLINDITRNSLGFRITNDGRIGYRMIVDTCQTGLYNYAYSSDGVYAVIEEEYSEKDAVWDNEITFISVRMILDSFSDCSNGNRTFKLFFYVNAKLVFISKELPELLLRKINDTDQKQEGLSYNISLGGGTQGLCDMIGFNDKYSTNYLLPIEKYFAGTFIGNIYKFRINYDIMDYSKIKNNYDYEFYKSFNGTYIRPSVTFWLEGTKINAPETAYNRELGNIDSKLIANVKLNNPYCTITSYKLYKHRSDSINKELIGEFYDMPPYGGDITYTFIGNESLNKAGLLELKFSIEVLDTCNSGSTGTVKDKNIKFDNMIFYGTLTEQPTTPNFVRADSVKEIFSAGTYELIIRTGARDKIFIIAVPENRDVTLVVDQSAAYTDITRAFEFSIINIEDAGGRLTPYKVYKMSNAIPYNKNHNLMVYIN